MSRHGIVLKTEGAKALISTARESVCASCAEKTKCAFTPGSDKALAEEVWAENPVHALPGDWVEFDLPGHGELKLSFLIWGLPLAGLLAGAFAGARVLPLFFSLSPDLTAALGAFLGLGLAFVPLILYDRLASRGSSLLPRIIRILRPGCDADSFSSPNR